MILVDITNEDAGRAAAAVATRAASYRRRAKLASSPEIVRAHTATAKELARIAAALDAATLESVPQAGPFDVTIGASAQKEARIMRRRVVQVQLVNNRALNRWYVGFIREPAANCWTYSHDYIEPTAASIARLARVANARAKAGNGHVRAWPTGWGWRLAD